MKYFKLILILFLIVSCKLDGTDTGNPDFTSSPGMDSPVTEPSTSLAISGIVYTLCAVISDCDDVIINSCSTSLQSQNNFAEKLGLNESDYETVADIKTAELAGIIFHSSLILDPCIEDISRLTCTDTGVDEAYDPSKTNRYKKTAGIIPASCDGMYDISLTTENEE